MQKVYPSWRYHKSLEPRIVRSAEEDQLLGSEWKDSPARFEEEPVVVSEVSNPQPSAPADPVSPPVGAEDQKKEQSPEQQPSQPVQPIPPKASKKKGGK